VLSLAGNIPGPLAAARLQALGAAICKVEPPGGDALAAACPAWYAALHAGQEVIRLNLKGVADRAQLDPLLAVADLLITASRPAGLARLGLAWNDLHAAYPDLCQVAIVGHSAPAVDRPGHDLTYQAAAGLLAPPALPRALLADLAGAERTVAVALALLLVRQRGQGGGYQEVALVGIAEDFAAPLRYGLTAPGGLLGGGLPSYNIYPAQDGWIALAALEPAFLQRLQAALHVTEITHSTLADIFRTQPAPAWEQWAITHDLPLVAVHNPIPNADHSSY
jgi:crotonobetainyl-CoA:carnitine CoA-transferase CaiB-like acyl-CoA transferase